MAMTKPEPIDDVTSAPPHGRATPRFDGARTIGAIVGGAAVLVILWAAFTAKAGSADSSALFSGPAPASAVRPDKETLRVFYKIQSSPTTTEESSMEQVVAIEFRPDFVVLKTKSGSGMAISAHSLRSLVWTQQP